MQNANAKITRPNAKWGRGENRPGKVGRSNLNRSWSVLILKMYTHTHTQTVSMP